MPIPLERRELMSQQPFTLICPSCHQSTQTQYSVWDIEILKEHSVDTEIKCLNCGIIFQYIPKTGEAM